MIQELDTVALTHDIPEHYLKQGDRGAVVHCYRDGEAFEVEFVNSSGQTIALLTLTDADIQKVETTAYTPTRSPSQPIESAKEKPTVYMNFHGAVSGVAANVEGNQNIYSSNQASGAQTLSQPDAKQRNNSSKSSSKKQIEVFFSYAHADEPLRDELAKHLSNLKRQGIITDWYDRDITAGTEWDDEIKTRLETADIILLLISADFMASDYIHNVEVERAVNRHKLGEARVIPVILRPVDWKEAPFSKFQALPKNAKPVTTWSNQDEAFLNVVQGIRTVAEQLR